MFGQIYSSSSYDNDDTLPSVPIPLNVNSWWCVHLQRSHGFREHDWDEFPTCFCFQEGHHRIEYVSPSDPEAGENGIGKSSTRVS